MGYLRPFHRLVVSGTLSAEEGFSYGLSLINTSQQIGVRVTSVPQAVIDAVSTFHQASALIANEARITTIKLNQIGTDGRYVSEEDTVLYDFETPLPGASVVKYPPQVALAISLKTAKQRGRARAGRFYIPYPAAPLSSNGYMAANEAQNVADIATVFLNSLNAAMTLSRVGVVSNLGTGHEEPVTHVEVGRIFDTIRSRRRSLKEDAQRGVVLTDT